MFPGLRSQSETAEARAQAGHYALTVIAFGVTIGLLYWARSVLITSLVAVIIAFLLEPFVGLLTKIKLPRPLAAFVVCGIAVAALYLIGLSLWDQLSKIARDAPEFKNNLAAAVESVSEKVQGIGDSVTGMVSAQPKPAATATPATQSKKGKKTSAPAQPAAQSSSNIQEVRIHDDHSAINDYVVSSLGTLYQVVLMASFVPFLVFFMLSWRDHIYKSFLRFFEGADRLIVARSVSGISTVARAFVVGNFMIGIILAALSSALFAAIHVPYPFLIGSISGFLSLTPYIGLPLGMAPPVFVALATGSSGTVILLSFLVVLSLHFFAMNVFYPKLVGARVHLNPLVVTFSLMFWGFLWDAAGLLLAIPITAGIKAICDNVAGLKPYGRFLGD